MSNANHELTNKLATAKANLASTLKLREEAENAVVAAEEAVAEHRKVVETILNDEGKLGGTIGELENMQKAFEAAPEDRSNN